MLKVIERDGQRRVIEELQRALDIYRHSTSHLMALAVLELFPGTHLGIGPATSEGFYYDFELDHRFTDEDLPRIEEKMRELAKSDIPFEPTIITVDEAERVFAEMGERLKCELIDERKGETLSCYRLGQLYDFCTGPHVESTGKLKHFKLLSIAGSYWRGDEHREQLQRIYGTAFFSREDLENHLAFLEEAKRRDHRRLGKELDLFSFHEEAGSGFVYWHPRGAFIKDVIERYWKEEHFKRGYELVSIPHVARHNMWRTSGHYEYYKENMYTLDIDEEEYVVKPMNCPGHILIYQTHLHSYRELPVRYAELGTVYRYEKSGVLHGTLRVRGFTQDDAHIFCTPDQVIEEIDGVLDLCQDLLETFGFHQYEVELSVRDPQNKEKYAGSDEEWELAEKSLVQAMDKRQISYRRMEGEAVFYGPKIDFKLVDAIGRKWQCSTVQFDFNLPKRFNITYVGKDSQEHHVYMIHRAIMGSLERFFGTLVEHYAGAFPLWLTPEQARVIPVSEKFGDYAAEVTRKLKSAGLRVHLDDRNEKVGYKIRDAQLQKIPYMIVVGGREQESGAISVRNRFDGDLGSMEIAHFVDTVKSHIDSKSVKP
ncbi:MAG: threonine--tRNA ligase [Acidobacteria bacterium]|nr:threonine--tRNA ligase [Acidobacteriota bacterium]